MKIGVFDKSPDVQLRLARFVPAEVNTEGPYGKTGAKILLERYGREFVPLYAVIGPDGEPIGQMDYPSEYAQDMKGMAGVFVKFLDDMLEKAAQR